MASKPAMCSRGSFVPPSIDDDDIRWATRLLGLPEEAFYGSDGKDKRQAVLRCMQDMDVAACPGSGKTTLLVAKLAILAGKWREPTRGICVLSHTNAARHQVEDKLGNSAVGRRLLSYPHFVGTIHAFVNALLAVPWLRSLGYPITMIDTEVTLTKRWHALPWETRNALEKNKHNRAILSIKSPDFGLGKIRWSKRGTLGAERKTYRDIQQSCRASMLQGYFCHDEMFVWATDLMDKAPWLLGVIRERFPLLFIDEAQDNTEQQSAILHRVFMEGASSVIRQRFGDPNQAIFGYTNAKGASTDSFPSASIKKTVENSLRFGQRIADLADPLGLAPYGMKGQGPLVSLGTRAARAQHTAFLFTDDNAGEVLPAYGGLLIDTFSQEELREGTFVAVGHVHRPPDEEKKRKFPHHVGHYWHSYDPQQTVSEPKPRTFVQYVAGGQARADAAGEAYPAVEKIAEGILRLSAMARARTRPKSGRWCHRQVLRLLNEHKEVREEYQDLLVMLAAERRALTRAGWEERLQSVVRQVAETVAADSLCAPDATAFLDWPGRGVVCNPGTAHSDSPQYRGNTYRSCKGGKEVTIQVGSIHSVKGQTHTATLVLETFWHEHSLARLRNWLSGKARGAPAGGSRIQTHLKTHYVAMTRPTHLLCIAMKRDDLSEEDIGRLEACGWRVKLI